MKLRELISQLMDYNMDAEVDYHIGYRDDDTEDSARGKSTATHIYFYTNEAFVEAEQCCPTVESTNTQEEVQLDPMPVEKNPRAASVGNNTTSGKGDWFKGTTWG